MSDDTARAFWVVSPGHGEIRTEILPRPAADDVVVRALYSGVSRGTEALVFHGRVPSSEYTRMRAPFQSGDFPAPVKYGYSNVGVIERGATGLLGRNVFVLYPHQTRYVVPAASVHVLPDSVPPPRAVLAANLETAINALWDARPHVGDRIAVIGAGAVGCLIAWLAARMPGCEVELVDVVSDKAEAARVLGARFVTPEDAAADVDLVFHATGSPAGLAIALRLAGFEATIVELSWYGDQEVSVPLGEAFHARRLTLQSSQVATIASSQRARWTTERRMQLALGLLADPVLDVLISGESDLESLPQVMKELSAGAGRTLCHRIRY